MPRINADVSEKTARAVRAHVKSTQSTVHGVVELTISLGLKELKKLDADKIKARLPRDQRRRVPA